jgi:hypothetical protein
VRSVDPEARGFVEDCGWDGVVDEFVGLWVSIRYDRGTVIMREIMEG